MRLSISNIAWDIDEDEQVSLLLARGGIYRDLYERQFLGRNGLTSSS